ncbi:DUF4145 domain-containing protein [Frateuria edaphi]|uniref:DUF4145 domain-containing protein n=1 Tax=Frateuria edaphi TaxID=2898793 RepID=UPI001E4BAD1D|nr:DUF4145 domain-containing protein [Frateuria edaphi]UGB45134.1 DUF4145 domain-containing protein [Frateuria edaphi]
MSEIVEDCPRCGAHKVTFSLFSAVETARTTPGAQTFELFAACRACGTSTVFVLKQRSRYLGAQNWDSGTVINTGARLREFFELIGYISAKDRTGISPPEYLPDNIENAFNEGAICLAVGCPNAAAAMFRLCIDLATKPMLPADASEPPPAKIRRSLGLRLEWLFENNRLSSGLRELAECLHQDGNDGAHDGTLTLDEAQDLLDFTVALLERMYTEPRKLELAKQRRDERRGSRS